MGEGVEQVVRRLWERMEARDWDGAAALLAEDFVAEWPQTRERYRGRDAYMAMNRAYPGDWHLIVERVVGLGDQVFSQVALRVDGGEIEYAASLWELRDGLIQAETTFWAASYEPPDARAEWSERM